MLKIVTGCFLLCLSFSLQAQYKTKKYLKKNRKAPVYAIGNEKAYARGLLVEGNRVFAGHSDGTLYFGNLEQLEAGKDGVQQLFKLDNFTEMRDVERSGDFLIGMQSGDNGELVRISNEGKTELIKPEEWKGRFMDAMDFKGPHGLIFGDPVDGKFSLFVTHDSGKTWKKCIGEINAEKGEAGFAASGTNVRVFNEKTFTFISGGEQNRFFKTTDGGKTWLQVVLPFYPGKSSGAFSMCFADEKNGCVVGGDFESPDLRLNTAYYTNDGGLTWLNSVNTPRGYRSCVYFVDNVYYACGRNGIDFSLDGGKNWTPFADGKFFSLGSNKKSLIATTTEGKIQVFDLIKPKK